MNKRPFSTKDSVRRRSGKRVKEPHINIRTIEGRLLMVDFKEHETRCRIHPSIGAPVLCLFGEEQKGEILDNILSYVRVTGEAREDPASGKIASIKIQDIERMEGHGDEATNQLSEGTPILRNFWESPTLDELAMSQNVQPLVDVRILFGTWPGEEDDGFETSIDELRQFGVKKDD